MTEPNGLNTKLAAVLTSLGTALSDLASLVADFNGIRGEDNLTLGDIISYLSAIRSAAEGTRSGVDGLSSALLDTMGLREGEDGKTLWQLLNGIHDHIGIPTGDATTTLLGRLAAIERLSKCNCPPEAPDLTDPAAPCTEPFISNPVLTRVSSAYPGRVFAGWTDPPPDGLTLTTFLETDISPAEIVRSTDISGWSIYIQSTARLASLSPLSVNLVATNTWLDLDLYDEHMAISVPEGNDLLVYICVPEAAPEACPTWTSNDYGSHWVIDWTETAPTYNYVGDFYGYTVRLTEPYNPPAGATPVKFYMYEQESYGDPSQIPTIYPTESPQTVNVHTLFLQCNEFKNSTAGASFTIELCPPEGS